jgi:hypothetical protein
MVAMKGISEDELVSTGVDRERARDIKKLSLHFGRYQDFKRLTRLGVTIRPDDLPFDKGLIFAWIAEGEASGRSN